MFANRRTLLVLFAIGAARVGAAQGGPSVGQATRIADPTLPDAAIAVADAQRPVIFYNPRILEQLGPAMATFILAHEEAHIVLGHVRLSDGVTDPRRLRRLELEADCHAAQQLEPNETTAVMTAAQYFAARGGERVDPFHPSAAERSARIRSCAAQRESGEVASPRPIASATPKNLALR
jgi:hypothetical protein